MTEAKNESKTQYAYPIKLDWMTVESRMIKAYDANGNSIFGATHGALRGTDFYFDQTSDQASYSSAFKSPVSLNPTHLVDSNGAHVGETKLSTLNKGLRSVSIVEASGEELCVIEPIDKKELANLPLYASLAASHPEQFETSRLPYFKGTIQGKDALLIRSAIPFFHIGLDSSVSLSAEQEQLILMGAIVLIRASKQMLTL